MSTSTKSGTTSPEANAFPQKSSKVLIENKNPLSPSRSTFSFDNEDSASSGTKSKPDVFDETQIARKADRDAALMSMAKRDQQEANLSRRKSQFYSEVFAYREPNLSARNKIHQHSIITAEVKTNVIVGSRSRSFYSWSKI